MTAISHRCLFCFSTLFFIFYADFGSLSKIDIFNRSTCKMKFHRQANIILVLTLVAISNATIAPPNKNKRGKATKEIKVNKGPVDRNVFERNLVQDEPTSEAIIKECGAYYKNTSARLFDGPTLGFVTPVTI